MKIGKKIIFIVLIIVFWCVCLIGNTQDIAKVKIYFNNTLQEWDGFGVNYVETSQTPDYNWFPQDYGGFSFLNEANRKQIIKMVFGENGLKPNLAKMFLDPFHQETPDSKFDHDTSTKWMRYFIQGGLKLTRNRGDSLTIITTLYGPPGWATKQKFLRGRDLDPEMKEELATYMIHWVKYCQEKGFPVKYISIHNEGEAGKRWPGNGTIDGPYWYKGHDYNMYWPPEQVVDFLSFMPSMMAESGINDVGMTPGETTSLEEFEQYAKAIVANQNALNNVSLITNHGFKGDNPEYESLNIMRSKRAELHTWITSMQFGKDWNYNVEFLKRIYNHIYLSRVNAIIPWTISLNQRLWRGGAWNGTAFWINDDGSYEPRYVYYLFKQICPVGQAGMAIAQTSSNNPDVFSIAFQSNNTQNPDAFVIVNQSVSEQEIDVIVEGYSGIEYKLYRTDEFGERCKSLDNIVTDTGKFRYVTPPRSVTTFISIKKNLKNKSDE